MQTRPRLRALQAAFVAACLAVGGLALAAPASAAPNGRLLFASSRSGNLDVWSMASDGSSPLQLTAHAATDTDPTPSGDGARVAFVSARDGNSEVYVMDADGSDETRLTNSSETESLPAFAPDGTKIAFVRAVGGFDAQIWIMDSDGGNETQLTNEAEPTAPAFSPDGGTIAFELSSQIHTMDLDGNNVTPIGAGKEPSFLPDGRIVVRNANEIYVMDADGSNAVNLTNHPSLDREPTTSPDGTKIAFSTFRNAELDVFVMNVDGSSQTNLTTTSADDRVPAWSTVPPASGPETTISSAPPTVSNDTTPTFVFDAGEPATYQCSLELSGAADDFASCASPLSAGPLTDGAYVFKVRATDDDLVVEDPPALHTFTVDTVAPVVTISSDPGSATNDATPTFAFSAPDAASYACSLRITGSPDSYSSCTSPFTASPAVADGSYTFKVRATDAATNTGSSDTHAFAVDTVAPTVSITADPGGVTNDSTPSFSFSASGATGLTCSVRPNGSAPVYAACASPFTASPALADGNYTFTVRAADAATNASTDTHDFTVDTVGPTTTISADPGSVTNDSTPSFTFAASGAQSFACSLRTTGLPDSYSACTSPFTANPALTDGSYTFKVRATDAAANTGTPDTHAFTVDTVAPSLAITADPGAATNDTTPSFSFSLSGAAGALCSLRPIGSAEVLAPCTSPFTSVALADGNYAFVVRATDIAGNGSVDWHLFAVDTVAPVATITADPGTVTSDATPGFSFTVTGATSVTCSLQPTGSPDSFAACTSPFTAPSTLSDGAYTFAVRGADAATNATTDTHSFTIDTVAPIATISADPGPVTNDTTPSFTFSAPGALSHECSVRPTGAADSFAPCTSPFTATTLTDGAYTFKVRSTDSASNVGAPDTHGFTVDTVAPDATITSDPGAVTKDPTPSLSFSVAGAVTTECSLRPVAAADVYASCASPFTAGSPLGEGPFTFKVRATDAAGNTRIDTHNFTVDTTAPTVTVQGKAKTYDRTPKFTLASSEAGTYECAMDLGAYGPCSATFISAKLKYGRHVLHVRATDAATNLGPVTDFSFKLMRR